MEIRFLLVIIKIFNLEIFSWKLLILFKNGVRNYYLKFFKMFIFFYFFYSFSRKYLRFFEFLSFNDFGYLFYRFFIDLILCLIFCLQMDFDVDEIWIDGVMDLFKLKVKYVELS